METYPKQITVMYSVWTRKVRRDGDFYPVYQGAFLNKAKASAFALTVGGEVHNVEV